MCPTPGSGVIDPTTRILAPFDDDFLDHGVDGRILEGGTMTKKPMIDPYSIIGRVPPRSRFQKLWDVCGKLVSKLATAMIVGAIALTFLDVFQRVGSRFGFVHRELPFSRTSWM